jgi:hypothetical protein
LSFRNLVLKHSMDEDCKSFLDYFFNRAQISDGLTQTGSTTEALILSTTSLDSLGKIWAYHFADEASQLASAYGGGLSESQRLAHILKKFTGTEDIANRLAVVCFAEDWKKADPQKASFIDSTLLAQRALECEPRESPRAYLDVSLDELLAQHPEIEVDPRLIRVAREYQYGAILYRMYRCPLIHSSLHSCHTHGFARNEEVKYWRKSAVKTSIGFGPLLVTRWLRKVAEGLVHKCILSSINPCLGVDPDVEQDRRLSNLWSTICKL